MKLIVHFDIAVASVYPQILLSSYNCFNFRSEYLTPTMNLRRHVELFSIPQCFYDV